VFVRSARFYDALYHFKDYAAASERLHRLIQGVRPGATTLLDVACGTGRHLEHLQEHYRVEGLDLSPDMLQIARQRCPLVPFHEGDMVSFNLGRPFHVVTCLFSSIGRVKTVVNLYRAVSHMAEHLSRDGLLIIEPWFTPEGYWVNHLTANFLDQPDLKVAWMYVSRRVERLSILDIHYLIGTRDGIESFEERHELGLFTHQEYEDAFRRAGLTVEYDAVGFFGRGAYFGIRRATAPASSDLRPKP
jgi:SAM-dependent methyltransferase